MRLHYFDQLNPKSGELCDDELDNVAGGCSDDKTDEPQKYYNAFTDGMKVKSGNTSCASFTPGGCMGQYRGTITFTSPTTWYCVCSKCGAKFTGSGTPKDISVFPDT